MEEGIPGGEVHAIFIHIQLHFLSAEVLSHYVVIESGWCSWLLEKREGQ